MKKILFITTAYVLKNSSAAIRNNSLVKGLVSLGYEVDVVSIEWPKELSSSFFEQENNGNIYLEQLPNLIRIARIKQSKTHAKNAKWIFKIRRILKKILFFPDECYQWKGSFKWNRLDQYTSLISSSDHKTSHFVALKIKKDNPSLLWVQIWGDPWSSDVNILPLIKPLAAHYEKKLLKASDRIVYVSSITMDEMKKKYPQMSKKMYYIPRGYYFKIDSCARNVDPIKIVYTGVLSSGRNPFALLDALVKLKISTSNIVVEFYGDIPVDLQKRLLAYPFVRLHDSLDFEYIPEILKSSSLLLYLSNRKGSSQIPGKLFDYMGTNRPILCLVSDTEDPISSFLRQFERCIVIENRETEILDNWAKIESVCSKRFQPEERFSPRFIASQLVDLL